MSQQTNITFRVSGDESASQGTSLSLEQYLGSEDTLADRLQKGSTGTMDRLLKLKEQLDKLSGTVINGQREGSRTQPHE